MSCVVERQFHIGRDIGDASVIENDCVLERLPHHVGAIRNPPPLLVCDVDVVDLKECHEVAGGWGDVHRTGISIFI